MGKTGRRWRTWTLPAGRIVAPLAAIIAVVLAWPALAAAAPLSIRIEGNHFVDGEGQTIRLLGVDRTSSEYGCVDGFGYDDGHFDAADAAAIASWNADAVRVPLNEDCWLGINGQPNSGGGANPPLTVTGYRQEIESYVAALNAHGIYAILDLHWSAPGTKVADGQQPMPDEHSISFWSSVAASFKGDPAVVFDVFNEPFSPADPRSGDDPAHQVSWSCWRNGGCAVPYYEEGGTRTTTIYTAVGMQALVDAIRATGATQPVMVGGLDYANDLTGWVANAPIDPLGQEAASFHNYMGKSCDNIACWNAQVAPVAADVPVVTGEFAQDLCAPGNFDAEYMSWADAHGVGYLAWAWVVLSAQEIAGEGCSAYYLITDYGGTPAFPNGTILHEHLLTLPAGGRNPSPPATPIAGGAGGGTGPGSGGGQAPKERISLTRFTTHVGAGDRTVVFRLAAAESCAGTIVGRTAKAFRIAGHGKRRKVVLGTAGFRLTAGKPAIVDLKLGALPRRLLEADGSLRARFVLTLSSSQSATTTLRRAVRLRTARARSA